MQDAALTIGDQELILPALVGSEGEVAFDISKLRATTGATTFDRGFGNTAETKSAITFINGEEGILRYRGYPIEDLVKHAGFLEVALLLTNGELPNKQELADYKDFIAQHGEIDDRLESIFDAFPPGAHPMQVLSSAMACLGTFYQDDFDPLDPAAAERLSRKLIGKIITVAASFHQHRLGNPQPHPNPDVDYATRFLEMMFGEVDPIVGKAFDALLILHADHEQNCSASAVRLVGSGNAPLAGSIAAGIQALSGPLHGGANQAVVEMLSSMVAEDGNVQHWISRAKDKNDKFRLMGFGHRVYRNFDPRARIIKDTASQVLEALGVDDPLLDMAVQLEEIALSDDYFAERKLYPNVDFYSGILYRAMGFPLDMFTVLFAIGRLPGWIAQWEEMHADSTTRIGRPRQVYTGETMRRYPGAQGAISDST